ncbi:hypothetical protein GCM10009127_18820 [Alteraurantiacibacter aestuarii]
MQRHHLLPKQLLSQGKFKKLFGVLGQDRIGFDDFRRNGLLLPAIELTSLRLGMPLHRGPHRAYNEVVAERIHQIEAGWAKARAFSSDLAAGQAIMRLGLLQSALRRRLLAPRRHRLTLNSKDPVGQGIDFSALDAMAEALWEETEVPSAPA